MEADFSCDLVLTTQDSPMYFRKKTSGGRAYLQIVESRRDGGQVRQQVIATLGRYEDLRESGQLERLLRSGARFSCKAMVVDAVHDGSAAVSEVRRLGPALAFERLWEETGCRAVIEELAGARKGLTAQRGRESGCHAKNKKKGVSIRTLTSYRRLG